MDGSSPVGVGSCRRDDGLGNTQTTPTPSGDGDGLGDTSDTDGELWDDEVGVSRAGRLVGEDEGGATDDDSEMFAGDVGADGAGASAEEAAVHLVEA